MEIGKESKKTKLHLAGRVQCVGTTLVGANSDRRESVCCREGA